jgi:hypothetical protein
MVDFLVADDGGCVFKLSPAPVKQRPEPVPPHVPAIVKNCTKKRKYIDF